MQLSLFAGIAGHALERLDLPLGARALLLGGGAQPAAGQPPVDALVCVEPQAPLELASLARGVVAGGWLAFAALDGANRLHAALAEGLGAPPGEALRLPALASLLRELGFGEVQAATAADELCMVPTQDWLLRNGAGPALAHALAALAPAARAALLREVAARLKDLWRQDAFRVPVAIDLLYARKRTP